jgi:hypothetical protein
MANDFIFHSKDDQFGPIRRMVGNALIAETVFRPYLKDHIQAQQLQADGTTRLKPFFDSTR